MGQIGMDISVEELRRQFSDAVERLAEQRADLDQATQEVTRLREELKTTRDWAENFAHTATDNGAARDRYKAEMEEARDEIDRLHDELDKQGDEINRATVVVGDLERELEEKLEAQSEAMQEQIESLREERNRYKEGLEKTATSECEHTKYCPHENYCDKEPGPVCKQQYPPKKDPQLPIGETCACGGKIVHWRDRDLDLIGRRCKKCHTKWRNSPKPKTEGGA